MQISISLIALTGSFETDLKRAGRTADQELKGIQRSAEAAGKVIGSALLAGFAAASAAVALYVKNTIEAEEVQAQIASRLKDTGEAAGRTADQLNAQAKKLEHATVFDDESIGRAQAALLTFTQISGINFDRTIEAATDLATVMGTGVPEAAQVLGKALSDPIAGIGTLRKAGVTLTEDQKHLVKSMQEAGDMAGAQGVILDALAGKMGSAAEAARDTLGGALKALTNSFNDLLEGNANDNGMRAARDAIEHFNDSLNDPSLKAGVDEIITDLARIAEVAGQTIAGLHDLEVQLRDTFSANDQKTTLGLLERQEELQNRLTRLRDGQKHAGVNRLILAASDIGLGPDIAQIEGELSGVKALLKQRQELMRLAASKPPAGVSFRNTGTVVINADPDLWGKGTGSADGAAKRAAAEAARAQKQAIEDLAGAHKDLEAQLEDQARQLGGPSLEAALQYKQAMESIAKTEDTLSRLGKLDVDSQHQIATARDQAAAAYHRELDAIAAVKSPLQKLLDDQAREISLLGLTGAALETASQLYGQNAADVAKYGDAIARNNEQLEQVHKLTAQMDDLRQMSVDGFMSIEDGSKSALDALKAFGDGFAHMLEQMAAQWATTQLFGAQGSTGGGLFGNLFSSLFGMGSGGSAGVGSLISGSYATGTDYAAGGWSIVGEKGPELVNLPRGSQVVPNHQLAMASAGAVTQNIQFMVNRRIDNRSQLQIAQDMERAGRTAVRRNGR